MKIFKNAWFGRFVRRENITADMLCDAVDRAEREQVDADLGGGVIKQRIARTGGGKSGGYRSILLFRKGDKAYFVFGFAKSELDNISKDELSQFKKMAKRLFTLSELEIEKLIANGQLEEVKIDAKKISK